ncbi:hypothetical protein L7F22_014127 [Adiantum nelumboides]|nr:hypothetical protein [Adiantum nelumboides]
MAQECFYNKNYVRERPYGPPAEPPQPPPPRYQVEPNVNAVAGADRPQPVLGQQPPLPHENRAMIRYAQPYEAPQPYITEPKQPIRSSDCGIKNVDCKMLGECDGEKCLGILNRGDNHFQDIIASHANVITERTRHKVNFAWHARLGVKSDYYEYKRARVDGCSIQVCERHESLSVMEKKGEKLFAISKGQQVAGMQEFVFEPMTHTRSMKVAMEELLQSRQIDAPMELDNDDSNSESYQGSRDTAVAAFDPNEEETQQWLMLKEGDDVIAGDVHLTPKLVSKVFKLTYLFVPVKGKKVTDSKMKGEFGNLIGTKSCYMVRSTGGIQAANLFWYLEKVCILQKTAYMSKEAFAPLYQVERGVKVDWATILYNRMQLTGKRDHRRTPAVAPVAPYLASIFENVLKVTPAPSGMKTPISDTLLAKGTMSGSKRRKLLLGFPTIDVKSPFTISWKDLEESDSKAKNFYTGSELKKSESKGKKVTLFLPRTVGSARKHVSKSSMAKEGGSASHSIMGTFSAEEANNFLIDLGKFLHSQDEALKVLENARQEHKCSDVSEGELQKIRLQLNQEQSDKEKLQVEVAKLQAEGNEMKFEILSVAEDFQQWVVGLKDAVDEQFKDLDEKVAALATENVMLINRLNPLAEMEKAVLQGQGMSSILVADSDAEEMKTNRQAIEDSLSKLKAEISSGPVESDQNLAAEVELDAKKQVDLDFPVEKAVKPETEEDIAEQPT